MNAEQLRAIQSPLKELYKSDPASALVKLRSVGRIGNDVDCHVETWRGHTVAGLHPATGGHGSLACSGDMLLQALAGCAGVTLGAVASAMEIPIRAGRVVVEGDLDFRGTLGVSKDAPVGFKAIRVVAQTLRAGCAPAMAWRCGV